MSRDRTVTAVLVRHGETEWNRRGRIQGWAQVPLNDRGREQARRVGSHLASTYEFDRVVASDLRRTRETAARIHEHGVEPAPEYTRDWRERHFGVYQGLTREELFGRHPEFRASGGTMGVRTTPEGGESLLDLRERVLEAWGDLLAETTGGETALVVTHGGPIYVLLGHVRGMDLSTAFTHHSQDNCAVTELRVAGEDIQVVRENESVSLS